MSAVLVTGATGTVGTAVVTRLVELGQEVVAGVASDTDAATVPAPAFTRVFRFGAPSADLEKAFDGVDRLFLMRPPAIADVATYLFPAIDAALRVGVRQIAFLSLQGVQANRKTPHHAVEAYLRAVGAPWTFLRPNFFMQNLSTVYAELIRDRDEIFVPAGRAHTAFIDARDVGDAAAAVLSTPGHLRKAYTLSGEHSLTYTTVATILSQVLGRPIRYSQPSEDAYLAYLRDQGASQDYLDVQRMIHRVVRLNVSALPNRKVRTLTGRPARTLETFAEDYQSAWSRA